MTKKEIIYKYISFIFAGIIILSLFYLFWVHRAYKESQFVFDDGSIEAWNDNWVINYDGNIEEGVSLPVVVPVEQGGAVILRKNLPDKIKSYNCIMISGKRQDITVSIGGIQRDVFSNEGSRPFGKTSPSGLVLVPLYNTDGQADVAIRYVSDSSYSGNIGEIYIGNEKSFMFKILKANIFWIFLNAVVLVIGIICAISFITYGNSFEITKAMLYLSLFAVLSAVWSFSQSGFRQILIDDIAMFEAIGYCGYMLVPIPVMLYVNWIMNRKYEPIIISGILAVIFNFAAENLIQAIFKVSFFEMRMISQIVYIGVVLLVLVLCIVEIKREFGTMSKLLLIGIVGLVFNSLQSVLPYGKDYQWGTYDRFIGGATIFLISGYIYTSMCVRKEQNLRKDAESANLAKNLFLATMSHEIKTPINAVVGMNEMIIRDSNEPVVLNYATRIKEASQSLLAIINDVLDFSRIESGKMDIMCVDYQLKSVLTDLILMTEMRIRGKELKLNVDIDPSIPRVLNGDEIRVKQVITNLLTNAVKYTPDGSITFSVKKKEIRDDEVVLDVSVKDTGIGIKDEDVSKFMDSFVRVEHVKNSNIAGLGLGLPITAKLLRLMDSKLEVDSVFGEGSDFHFTISQKIIDTNPIGDVREKKADTVKKLKVTFMAPDARILIVDDARINISVLKGLLRPTKVQIDSCESGKRCLELCKDNYYDLILMDHMMPEMDGIEAFKLLKSDTSLKSHDSKVIVFTANTISGAREMYLNTGFDYYLKKPVDINELNEVMQKYLPQEVIKPIEND